MQKWVRLFLTILFYHVLQCFIHALYKFFNSVKLLLSDAQQQFFGLGIPLLLLVSRRMNLSNAAFLSDLLSHLLCYLI